MINTWRTEDLPNHTSDAGTIRYTLWRKSPQFSQTDNLVRYLFQHKHIINYHNTSNIIGSHCSSNNTYNSCTKLSEMMCQSVIINSLFSVILQATQLLGCLYTCNAISHHDWIELKTQFLFFIFLSKLSL